MHGDEGGVRSHVAQPLDQVEADVDRDDLVAESAQRVLDAGSRAKRDLAL
jgi:hypothetical protein